MNSYNQIYIDGDLLKWIPEEDYEYTISGYSPGSRKCSLSLSIDGTLAHSESYNLHWAVGRKQFSKNCPEDRRNSILKHLLHLPGQLRSFYAQDSVSSEAPATEDEKQEVNQFLTSPNMLEEILEDFHKIGHVGEDRNVQLAYLIATSRLAERPLSGIIQGVSGAGKSNLLEKLKLLLPKDVVWFQSRISPKALSYVGRDELSHKVVMIAERVGSRDSDYSIRTLQSEGVYRVNVAEQNVTSGNWKSGQKEVRGPIALLESTTETKINNENTSRCFMLHPDCTSEQTYKVLQSIGDQFAGKGPSKDEKEAICRKHHLAQRALNPYRVYIPFERHIHFPLNGVPWRREYPRFLGLIGASALLHQKQRDIVTIKGEERVKATILDYEVAYMLAGDSIENKKLESNYKARELLTHLRHLESQGLVPSHLGATVKDLVKETMWSYSTVHRALDELYRLGLISRTDGKSGRTVYHKCKKAKAKKVLLTPEELEKNINKDAAS